MSDFYDWEQREYAEDWILFPQNIGSYLSIDETALCYDELYTIVTNKESKGKEKSIVAIIKGTLSDKVIEVLKKIPEIKRKKVKEVTLDMAANMQVIVRRSFPHAQIVIDRFHVQKLASEALQDIRIAYR